MYDGEKSVLRDNKSRAISPSQRGACRVVGRARASKGRRGLVKGGARRQIQLDLRGNEGDELVARHGARLVPVEAPEHGPQVVAAAFFLHAAPHPVRLRARQGRVGVLGLRGR